MADSPEELPGSRFTGLADLYARYRPGYPEEALDHILSRTGLGPRSLLIDVGCGTGIAARWIAARGIAVLGVEPNGDMRRRAEAESMPPGLPAPEYRAGQAEATGLPDALAEAVLSAQAFHWFDPQPALREFHRILKPGGWVILLWNERDETEDAFTAAYGQVIRTAPAARALEMSRGRAGEVLLTCALFANAEREIFRNAQVLDEEGLLGRAFSVSYAPRAEQPAREFTTALRGVFAQFQHDGKVALQYRTSVYLGQRPGAHT